VLSRASAQFANSEAIVETTGSVGALLGVAQSGDFYVRFNVSQLLATLVANHPEALQRAVVQTQQAVPQLMNLLADTRELIRNESLLLMIELTAHNQEIQKIVAFEGAFERLFDIATAEEERTNGRGSAVVHDALQLICTLLRGNVSNQNFFRETSCVQRIPPLLALAEAEQRVLSESKHRTLELALELVTLLVAGNNSATPKNQSALARAGTLAHLLNLAIGGVGSPPVRIKALHALGLTLKGHQGNIARFNHSQVARSNGERDRSVVSLLYAALGASSLAERRAALAAFADYLYENEADQLTIADSAHWPQTGVSSGPPSAGQALVSALLKRDAWAQDPYRAWFSACALVCVYRDNARAKQGALSRPLSGDAGPSLVMRLRNVLIASSGGAPRVLVGLLRLSIAMATDTPAIGAALLGFAWEDGGGATTLVDQQALPALVSLVTAGRVDAATSAASAAEDETALEDRRLHVRGCAALLLALVLTLTAAATKANVAAASAEGSLRSNLLSLIKHRLGGDQLMSILTALRRSADFAHAERAPLAASTDSGAPGAEDQAAFSFYYDISFVAAFKEIFEEVEYQLRYPSQPRRRPLVVAAEQHQQQQQQHQQHQQQQQNGTSPPLPPPQAAVPPKPSGVAPVPPSVVVAAPAAAPHVNAPPPRAPPTAPQKAAGDDDVMAQYVEMIGQQRREIDSLRAALGVKGNAAAATPDERAAEREMAQLRERLSATRDELVEVRNEADVLKRRLVERNEIIETMALASVPNGHDADSSSQAELTKAREELALYKDEAERKEHHLLEELASLEQSVQERDERIDALTAAAAAKPVATSTPTNDVALKARLRELERDVQRARDEFRALEHEQDKLMGDMAQLEIDNNNFRERLAALGDE
jgi:hypothetical protein